MYQKLMTSVATAAVIVPTLIALAHAKDFHGGRGHGGTHYGRSGPAVHFAATASRTRGSILPSATSLITPIHPRSMTVGSGAALAIRAGMASTVPTGAIPATSSGALSTHQPGSVKAIEGPPPRFPDPKDLKVLPYPIPTGLFGPHTNPAAHGSTGGSVLHATGSAVGPDAGGHKTGDGSGKAGDGSQTAPGGSQTAPGGSQTAPGGSGEKTDNPSHTAPGGSKPAPGGSSENTDDPTSQTTPGSRRPVPSGQKTSDGGHTNPCRRCLR